MNEKLSYAKMLDIPESTSLITVKTPKKRLFKKSVKKVKIPKEHEEVKKELIDKINSEPLEEIQEENVKPLQCQKEDCMEQCTSVIHQAKKKKGKIGIVGVQFVIIGVLLLLIVFTNALLPNSAINAFMNGNIGSSYDARTYQDFSPVLKGGTIYQSNVYSHSDNASVYSACDGVVQSVSKLEDGTITAVIKHSPNFSSLITGLDYFYYKAGDTVLTKVPVGYSIDGAETCFADKDGAIITGWTISGEEVKWAV